MDRKLKAMEEAKAVEEAMRRAAMERALREEEARREREMPELRHVEQRMFAARERLPEPLRGDAERWLAELFGMDKGGGAAFANQVVASVQTAQSPYRNWIIETAPSLIQSPKTSNRAAYLYHLPFNAEVRRERLAL